jgi:hypothetical protein
MWDLSCTKYNGEDIACLEIVSGATTGDAAIQSIGQAICELQVNAADKFVKISDGDTTSGFLKDKLKSKTGSAITISTKNGGLNEYLEIDAPVSKDELVKISSTDTSAGFLVDKVVSGTLVDVTKKVINGAEKLEIRVNQSALAAQIPPFSGSSTQGIEYISGGIQGHSPIYRLKLDSTTDPSLTLGDSGLKFTPDYKTKVAGGTPNYLDSLIEIGTDPKGLISIAVEIVNGKLKLTPTIDVEALCTALRASGCMCDSPSNLDAG